MPIFFVRTFSTFLDHEPLKHYLSHTWFTSRFQQTLEVSKVSDHFRNRKNCLITWKNQNEIFEGMKVKKVGIKLKIYIFWLNFQSITLIFNWKASKCILHQSIPISICIGKQNPIDRWENYMLISLGWVLTIQWKLSGVNREWLVDYRLQTRALFEKSLRALSKPLCEIESLTVLIEMKSP